MDYVGQGQGQPIELLSSLLSMADIHLLPQRAEAADLVMPSKLTGMLASGRPVVAMAQPGSALDKVVKQCGLAIKAGNPTAVVEAIQTLRDEPAYRQALGQAGRKFAQDALDKPHVLSNFAAKLLHLIDSLRTVERVEVAASPIGMENQPAGQSIEVHS